MTGIVNLNMQRIEQLGMEKHDNSTRLRTSCWQNCLRWKLTSEGEMSFEMSVTIAKAANILTTSPNMLDHKCLEHVIPISLLGLLGTN